MHLQPSLGLAYSPWCQSTQQACPNGTAEIWQGPKRVVERPLILATVNPETLEVPVHSAQLAPVAQSTPNEVFAPPREPGVWRG